MSLTTDDVTSVTSSKLGEIDRIRSRGARAAEQRIFYDECFRPAVALVRLEDERLGLHVVLTDTASAEAARSDCGPFAMPAIHR
jgi:hypothetical protein